MKITFLEYSINNVIRYDATVTQKLKTQALKYGIKLDMRKKCANYVKQGILLSGKINKQPEIIETINQNGDKVYKAILENCEVSNCFDKATALSLVWILFSKVN